MSQTIKIQNYPSINIQAQTSLSAEIALGVNSLPVINSAPFSNGGNILIGGLGSNGSELAVVGTLSNDISIPTTAATTVPHSTGDLVTWLFGTQINVYSAPDSASSLPGTGVAPPDSAFTKLSGMPINISPTMWLTTYTDAAGTTTTWYKTTFYNSTTNEETDLSASQPTWAALGNYCSLDEIRTKAGFKTNLNITNDLIDEKRQAAQQLINGSLIPVYVFPLPQPTNPIIAELTRNLAASYLTQDVYRTTNPEMVKQGEADEANALDTLDDLVTKRVVLVNAIFIDQTIPGGNGASGYPDETAVGPPTRANGGGSQLFWPGMKY